MENLGIEKLEQVLDLGLSLGAAYTGAMADGKFSWDDAIHLIPVGQKLAVAIPDVSKVADEVKDLDSAERARLESKIESFNLPKERLEKLIESSCRALLSLGELVALATSGDEDKLPEAPAAQ